LVGSDVLWPDPEPPNWFQYHEVLSTAKPDDPVVVREVVALLSEPATYDFTDVHTVSMNPGFGLRLETQAGPLDVHFDFDGNGVTISGVPRRDDSLWAGANFLPGRPKVVALMKRLFPNDAFAKSVSVEPDRVRRRLGDAAEVMRAPDRVEYFRVGRQLEVYTEEEAKERDAVYAAAGQKPPVPPPSLLGYEITGRVSPNDPKIGPALGAALTSETTYSQGSFFCGFNPGVGYRFVKGPRSVVVLICFTCWEMAVAEELKAGDRRDLFSKVPMSDEGSRAILDLTKRAFPDDPDIRKITTGGEPE
jgi:hypothetical protein